MFKTSVISVFIDRPYSKVYQFLADPSNLTRWMPSLGPVLRHVSGDEWIAERPHWPTGPLLLRFTPPNPYGVLDCAVSVVGGATNTTPIRLVPNGRGCEIVYLIRQYPGVTDPAFNSEEEWLRSDLMTVKTMLEAMFEAP